MKLSLEPRIERPDDVYELLLLLHDGLSREASERAMARLVLILANHIGDYDVISEAVQAARATQSDTGSVEPRPT
ncbi:MAG: DUF2783 domain-containing protein [Hyphomonadaceae bacterium]|nr:DUF2783 domain-containing protein [Hyphomonadaceae bacterium]